VFNVCPSGASRSPLIRRAASLAARKGGLISFTVGPWSRPRARQIRQRNLAPPPVRRGSPCCTFRRVVDQRRPRNELAAGLAPEHARHGPQVAAAGPVRP
jgi:hypothetical protein